MLGPFSRCTSVWASISTAQGWEDLYGGRVGFPTTCNRHGLGGPSRLDVLARCGQYIRQEGKEGCYAYPFNVLVLPVELGKVLSHAVGVMEGPYSQLVEHSEFGKDVEVSKVVRFLVGAVGMRLVSRLVFILCAHSFVPVVQPGHGLAKDTQPKMGGNIRQITTRRDELQQLKAHLFQDAAALGPDAFCLEVLQRSRSARADTARHP